MNQAVYSTAFKLTGVMCESAQGHAAVRTAIGDNYTRKRLCGPYCLIDLTTTFQLERLRDEAAVVAYSGYYPSICMTGLRTTKPKLIIVCRCWSSKRFIILGVFELDLLPSSGAEGLVVLPRPATQN